MSALVPRTTGAAAPAMQAAALPSQYLTFTLGGRYDWVSTDTDNTDLASGALSTINQSDRAFTWRAGVTYETEWGITPYASYSTAFSPNAGVNLATGNPFKLTSALAEFTSGPSPVNASFERSPPATTSTIGRLNFFANA